MPDLTKYGEIRQITVPWASTVYINRQLADGWELIAVGVGPYHDNDPTVRARAHVQTVYVLGRLRASPSGE